LKNGKEGSTKKKIWSLAKRKFVKNEVPLFAQGPSTSHLVEVLARGQEQESRREVSVRRRGGFGGKMGGKMLRRTAKGGDGRKKHGGKQAKGVLGREKDPSTSSVPRAWGDREKGSRPRRLGRPRGMKKRPA